MKTKLLVLLGLVLATPLFAQNTREIITIRYLTRALIRMGEPGIAKRLSEDYYKNKTVKFTFIKSADGNAETGTGLKGKNYINLSDNMLAAADMDKLLQERPYGQSSNLIGDALTVVHEYVHMDQTLPMNYPRWEDPAWQKTDKTLNNWVKKIEAEYNALRNSPESKEKTAKLTELMDIIKKLQSEAVSVRNSITANVKNKSLSPNQRWLIDDTDKRLKAMVESQKKYVAVGKMVPESPSAKKDKGYWEIVSVQVFDKLNPGDNNYSLSAGDGTLKTNWKQNNDVFNITATYTAPPKKIYPSDKIPVTMSVSVTNSGDQYSGNGDFALFFDKPDIDPGFVSAPISLSTEKGVNGYISFSHKPGSTPSPAATMNVFINGSSLPTGTKGAKIALIASLYNGRIAGYKYVYEWRDSW